MKVERQNTGVSLRFWERSDATLSHKTMVLQRRCDMLLDTLFLRAWIQLCSSKGRVPAWTAPVEQTRFPTLTEWSEDASGRKRHRSSHRRRDPHCHVDWNIGFCVVPSSVTSLLSSFLYFLYFSSLFTSPLDFSTFFPCLLSSLLYSLHLSSSLLDSLHFSSLIYSLRTLFLYSYYISLLSSVLHFPHFSPFSTTYSALLITFLLSSLLHLLHRLPFSRLYFLICLKIRITEFRLLTFLQCFFPALRGINHVQTPPQPTCWYVYSTVGGPCWDITVEVGWSPVRKPGFHRGWHHLFGTIEWAC